MGSSTLFPPAFNCPTGHRPAGPCLGASASERKKYTRKAAQSAQRCAARLSCRDFAR